MGRWVERSEAVSSLALSDQSLMLFSQVRNDSDPQSHSVPETRRPLGRLLSSPIGRNRDAFLEQGKNRCGAVHGQGHERLGGGDSEEACVCSEIENVMF